MVAAPPTLTGLPLRFEANRGQTDDSVRFIARGAGTVFIRPDEAVLAVSVSDRDVEAVPRRTAVSSSAIALSWIENAGIEDGFEIERSANGSSAWAWLDTLGADVTGYDDNGLDPEATWYYRVQAFNGEGDSAWSNVDGAMTFGTGGGTSVADGEIAVSGTVTGSFSDTHDSGGAVEAIQEAESGGKPSRRYSYLEHKWIFTLLAAPSHTLFVEGWCTDGGDGDTFAFEISTDGQNYVSIAGVEITPASGSASGALPGSPSGTVYIRVVDTDRSQGHRAKDTVSIDHLHIVSQ